MKNAHNMDECQNNYAEWQKPDKKEYMPYDSRDTLENTNYSNRNGCREWDQWGMGGKNYNVFERDGGPCWLSILWW